MILTEIETLLIEAEAFRRQLEKYEVRSQIDNTKEYLAMRMRTCIRLATEKALAKQKIS